MKGLALEKYASQRVCRFDDMAIFLSHYAMDSWAYLGKGVVEIE